MHLITSCNSKLETGQNRTEDAEAMEMLQGVWGNELEGDVAFSIKKDSIYYNDSLSHPTHFRVCNDTLFIDNHDITAYPITFLDETSLTFVNTYGDETRLVKSQLSAAPLPRGEHKGAITPNQGKKIKRDTIVVCNDKKYHAYTQVNPTTFKVYRQTKNAAGLIVESVYYDNIVYIALYERHRKLFGGNVTKSDFANIVPKTYLDQAVLSEINVRGAQNGSIRFVAILSIPDTYTNYRVNIDINEEGRKVLSI